MVYSWEDINSFRSFLKYFHHEDRLRYSFMPLSDLNIYDKMSYFFKECDELCDEC